MVYAAKLRCFAIKCKLFCAFFGGVTFFLYFCVLKTACNAGFQMRKGILFILSYLVAGLLGVCAQTDDEGVFATLRPLCSVSMDEGSVDDDFSRNARLARKVGRRGELMPVVGTPKIPVLLVDFPDRTFYAAGQTDDDVRATYDLFFNGFDDAEVQKKLGSTGSVFSYFDEMSHGQFLPDFEIIGPVRLDNGYAYYGSNSGKSKDVNMYDFYREAVMKAVNQYDVDWMQFDNNGDGKVDFIHFVYAGWGENTLQTMDSDGNVSFLDPDAIWAHEMTGTIVVNVDDGKSVSFASYGASAEARIKSGSQALADRRGEFAPTGYNPANLKVDGVGICIHEMSHAMGLPDFYDMKGDGYGMDVWSVMDYGDYVGSGYNPAIYNASERNFMGWEDLPVLREPQVVTIPCFDDGGCGYKIVSPDSPSEYYILENRQAKGWDQMACKYAHGLVVTHVDYDEGMQFFALEDDTNPDAMLNNGMHKHSVFMAQAIRNITENEDGSITLCFRTNGQLEVPEGLEAQEVGMNGFVASWQPVDRAVAYVTEMEQNGAYYCDTLRACGVRYDGLLSDMPVTLRVKAIASSPEDYVDSEWTDHLELTTAADFIAELPESEKPVTVYTMDGKAISHCMADEVYRLSLRKGIYIIMYSNGASKKIFVR